ncbi:Alkylated DNA repair protein alkB 8 [Entophlyctis luteolus]|nr:Alkylated DNA repair protein alkB 8 [Entophlyctis luteolus]
MAEPASVEPVEEELIERTHVQAVYQQIAGHFSATRYKPWPVVQNFLDSIPAGSIGADVGCGNGKYLGVNPALFTVGSDWSSNLVSIARSRGHECMVADNMSLPFRSGSFDFVLSIAVIHHFASFARRVAAVRELARVLRPGGKMLVFVWALEQEDRSKRRFEKQDVFVPWNLTKAPVKRGATKKVVDSNPTSQEGGGVDETDEKKTKLAAGLSALKLQVKDGEEKVVVKSGNENIVFQRYYHVFVQGELDSVVNEAGNMRIEESGYDRDNWYIIATKTTA